MSKAPPYVSPDATQEELRALVRQRRKEKRKGNGNGGGSSKPAGRHPRNGVRGHKGGRR